MAIKLKLIEVTEGESYPIWWSSWLDKEQAIKTMSHPDFQKTYVPNPANTLRGVGNVVYYLAVEDKSPEVNEYGEIAP